MTNCSSKNQITSNMHSNRCESEGAHKYGGDIDSSNTSSRNL